MDYEDLVQELTAEALTYGMQLTDKQKDKLVRHLMMVIEKNREFNLTSITDEHEAVALHIIDSLLMAPQVAEAPAGRFMDVGTGAGYPGIPLVIVSGRKSVLVDSVGKKAEAVSAFVEELGLRTRVTVRAGRVEEIARTEKGTYAVVVARAVAKMNTLVEYASPLLSMGGRLVITKSHPDEDEMDAGLRAAEICGFKPVGFSSYELPHGLGHREIYSYERVGRAKVGLPRKVGMAQHHPLGE